MLTSSQTAASSLGLVLRQEKLPYTGPFAPDQPYGEREVAAVKALAVHKTPKNYVKSRTSPALYNALYQLATNPTVAAKFKAAPAKFLATQDGLKKNEALALKRSSPGALRLAMKVTSSDVAMQFVQAELRDPKLAQAYAAILKANQADKDGQNKIAAWLKS